MNRILSLLIVLFATIPALAQETTSQSVFQKHQPAIEAAVEKALRYLATNQSEDGTYTDSYGRSVGIVSLVGIEGKMFAPMALTTPNFVAPNDFPKRATATTASKSMARKAALLPVTLMVVPNEINTSWTCLMCGSDSKEWKSTK